MQLLSPAKINLMLAVTGARNDGYHNLVSLVAPIALADTIEIELTDALHDQIVWIHPTMLPPKDNIITKALDAFRKYHAFSRGVKIYLHKKIPVEAGLGGGSSNASTVLKALNSLLGNPLTNEKLLKIASSLGSDCPLFFYNSPVIMRSRGEEVIPIEPNPKDALAGRKILLFKPDFGISTSWAYAQMRNKKKHYVTVKAAEKALQRWQQFLYLNDWSDLTQLPLLNNLEMVAFDKYLILPVLFQHLRRDYGLRCLMSGSGSACFALLPLGQPTPAGAIEEIKNLLGPETFIVETSFAVV